MNTAFKKLLRQSAAGLSIMLGAASLTPAAAQADWSMDDLIGPAVGAVVGAAIDKNHRLEHAAVGAAVGFGAQQLYKKVRTPQDEQPPPQHGPAEYGYSVRAGRDVVNVATLQASGQSSFRTNGFGSSAYTVSVNGNPVKALQAVGRLTQSTVIFPAEEAQQMVMQGEDRPVAVRLNVSRYSPESALNGMSNELERMGWSSNVVRRGTATAIVVGSPERVLDISQRIEAGQLPLPSSNKPQSQAPNNQSDSTLSGRMNDANSTMSGVNSTVQTAQNVLYTMKNLGR